METIPFTILIIMISALIMCVIALFFTILQLYFVSNIKVKDKIVKKIRAALDEFMNEYGFHIEFVKFEDKGMETPVGQVSHYMQKNDVFAHVDINSTIKIADHLSFERATMVLAHEIGHIIFLKNIVLDHTEEQADQIAGEFIKTKLNIIERYSFWIYLKVYFKTSNWYKTYKGNIITDPLPSLENYHHWRIK